MVRTAYLLQKYTEPSASLHWQYIPFIDIVINVKIGIAINWINRHYHGYIHIQNMDRHIYTHSHCIKIMQLHKYLSKTQTSQNMKWWNVQVHNVACFLHDDEEHISKYSNTTTLQDAYITKSVSYKTSTVTKGPCNVISTCISYTEKWKPPPTPGLDHPTQPRLCQEPVHGPVRQPGLFTLLHSFTSLCGFDCLVEIEWITGHPKKT